MANLICAFPHAQAIQTVIPAPEPDSCEQELSPIQSPVRKRRPLGCVDLDTFPYRGYPSLNSDMLGT